MRLKIKSLKQLIKEALAEEQKRAACVLIVSNDGKILSVARKNDPSKIGLPGGKVDPGETIESAARRECYEETGLWSTNLKEIFKMVDGEYETTTFSCDVEGLIETQESGHISWVTREMLVDPTISPFARYNAEMFSRMKR